MDVRFLNMGDVELAFIISKSRWSPIAYVVPRMGLSTALDDQSKCNCKGKHTSLKWKGLLFRWNPNRTSVSTNIAQKCTSHANGISKLKQDIEVVTVDVFALYLLCLILVFAFHGLDLGPKLSFNSFWGVTRSDLVVSGLVWGDRKHTCFFSLKYDKRAL